MLRHPLLVTCGALAILAGCVPSHRMTSGVDPARACPRDGGHRWYVPAEEADGRHLEPWCASVAPPVVRPDPRATFGGVAPGGTLEVWSWNVAAGGGDVMAFLQEEARLTCEGERSRFRRAGRHFVLLVQEAFRRSGDIPVAVDEGVIPRPVVEEERPGPRLDILDVADRCGLSLLYVPAARNGRRTSEGLPEDRGVAILSTLRLTGVAFVELPFEAARRVAAVASVASERGRLRIVNVHFISAAGPARVLRTGNGSRLRQGLAILDVMDQLDRQAPSGSAVESGPAVGSGPPGESTLLGGDLNTWTSDETTLRYLRDRFVDSPPPLSAPTRGSFPTDHVLFDRGPAGAPSLEPESYARVARRYHSDHHPIRVRVRFSR